MDKVTRRCEKCNKTRPCEEVPMMGFSLWLCLGCCFTELHAAGLL